MFQMWRKIRGTDRKRQKIKTRAPRICGVRKGKNYAEGVGFGVVRVM